MEEPRREIKSIRFEESRTNDLNLNYKNGDYDELLNWQDSNGYHANTLPW